MTISLATLTPKNTRRSKVLKGLYVCARSKASKLHGATGMEDRFRAPILKLVKTRGTRGLNRNLDMDKIKFLALQMVAMGQVLLELLPVVIRSLISEYQ